MCPFPISSPWTHGLLKDFLDNTGKWPGFIGGRLQSTLHFIQSHTFSATLLVDLAHLSVVEVWLVLNTSVAALKAHTAGFWFDL